MGKNGKPSRKRRGLDFNEYQALRRAIKHRRPIPIGKMEVVVRSWKHAVELNLCDPLTKESKGGRPATRLLALGNRVKARNNNSRKRGGV
jgi:hypothetical protein